VFALTDYDNLSLVTRSQYRREVVQELADRAKTPRQITDDVDHDGLAHISRALQTLRDAGLVELLVSEDTKKGRYYGLTEAGEEIVDELEERRAERGESPA